MSYILYRWRVATSSTIQVGWRRGGGGGLNLSLILVPINGVPLKNVDCNDVIEMT